MPTTKPPAAVARLIELRAARACFASAIGANMVALVAEGVAPRWWQTAPVGSFDRWTAFDQLEGLTHWAGSTALNSAGELRELLLTARSRVSPAVYAAGCTLADFMERLARS